MNAVFLFPLLDDKHWVLLEVTIVHGKRGDIKVYDSCRSGELETWRRL